MGVPVHLTPPSHTIRWAIGGDKYVILGRNVAGGKLKGVKTSWS